MSNKKYFLDDLTRVASGAIGTIGNVKGEVEAKIKDSIQRLLEDMDYVTREEFEVVKELAQKLKEENVALEAKLENLEQKIDIILNQTDNKA